MLAGILFAVTAKDVDLVIRSTVSVMFVLNIDEIVFEVCMYVCLCVCTQQNESVSILNPEP